MDTLLLSQKRKRSFVFDSTLQLYLPFWHPGLKVSPIVSKDLNGHSCIVTGALWKSYGRFFDATDDHIQLGTPWSQSLANINVYTIEGWARTTDVSAAAAIYGEGRTTTITPMVTIIMEGADLLKFYHRDDANNLAQCVADSGDIVNDTWFHFAAVRRAANSFELYVNTVSKATSSTNVGTTTVDRTDIGAKETTSLDRVWKGDIGEIRVYLAALSDADVVQNRNATRWRFQ